MKKHITLLLLVFIAGMSCQSQTESTKIHNELFNWTIEVPAHFEQVDPEVWEEMQNRGADAIENTFGEEVENLSKTLYAFKSGNFNYFDANYQPYDAEIDGDYGEMCKEVNAILYETFEHEMPDAQLDSVSSIKRISELDFYTFEIVIHLPNGMKMHLLEYSRLFGDKDFTVNILYIDKKVGEELLQAWTNSTFE